MFVMYKSMHTGLQNICVQNVMKVFTLSNSTRLPSTSVLKLNKNRLIITYHDERSQKGRKRSNEKRSKSRIDNCGRQTTEEVPTTLCPILVEAERSFVKNVEVSHNEHSSISTNGFL